MMENLPQRQLSCGSPNSENTEEPVLAENATILQILFQYYINDVKELAKCRLVSKTWNYEACDKMRKSVTIPLYFSHQQQQLHSRQPLKFMRIMEKSGDYPYAKYSIIVNEMEHKDMQEFFDNFGDLITHLKFRIDGGKHNNSPTVFKKLLTEQLPNLKSLQLFGLPDPISKQGDLFDLTSSGILRQLQSITFWRTPGEDNEAETPPHMVVTHTNRSFNTTPLYWNILEYSPNITTFQTNNINCFHELFTTPRDPDIIDSDDMENLVSRPLVFNRVKTFKMVFPRMETPPGADLPRHVIPVQFPEISTFCNVFPNITCIDLKLKASAHCPSNSEIENLITGCAKTLRRIRIQRHKYDSNSAAEPRSPPLRLVKLTHLSQMEMYHAEFNVDAAFFPALKYLSVTSFTDMHFNGRFVSVENTLSHVTTLKIGHEKLTHTPVKGLSTAQMDQIILMFPGLKTLHFPATDDSLHLVYEKYPELEELSIVNSNIYSHSAFNAYPELTDEGITGLHMRTCAKIQQDKNYSDIKPGALRNRPYIGMLKKLQRFFTKGTLTNVSIRFGIADITELNSLSFCHTQSPRKAPWCVCPSKVEACQTTSSPSNRRRHGNASGSNSTLEIDKESICLKPLADNCKCLVKLEIKTSHLNSTDAVTDEDVQYIKARLPNLELIIDESVEEFLDN